MYLDTQGRILVRVSMEGEKDDILVNDSCGDLSAGIIEHAATCGSAREA